MTDNPRVFISYAQESPAHDNWVLVLANRLRQDGVDAIVDRHYPWVERGWRAWMREQIESARWVLVVCTAAYRQRFDGEDPADAEAQPGRAVRWESQHITQELYDQRFRNRRFVPLLPPGSDASQIPLPLKDYTRFALADGDEDAYEALYRLLTDQPATPPPALGPLRRHPPLAEAAKARPSSAAQRPPAVSSRTPGAPATAMTVSKIFISYSQQDKKYCSELVRALKAVHSLRDRVWVDDRPHIEFGEQVDEVIRKGLEDSALAILLVSEHSLAPDGYVMQRELPFLLRQAERKALQLGICYVSHVGEAALSVHVKIDGILRSFPLDWISSFNRHDRNPLRSIESKDTRDVIYVAAVNWAVRKLCPGESLVKDVVRPR